MSEIPASADISMPDFGRDILRPLYRSVLFLSVFVILFSLWAVFAELVTTVRIQGYLTSTQPSHDLQHSRGGRIAAVAVGLHQHVERGDILFQFDVGSETVSLEETGKLLRFIQIENTVIREELSRAPEAFIEPRTTGDELRSLIEARYAQLRASVDLKIAAAKAEAKAAKQKAEALAEETALLAKRRRLHSARLSETKRLVDQGIFKKTERERIQEQKLALDAQIQAKSLKMIALRQDKHDAAIRAKSLQAERRTQLMDRLTRNIERLPELRMQYHRLRNEISEAAVRAPISGTISLLGFRTSGAVAMPGEVLAVLSEPLAEPIIELRVPVNHIDQVGLRMRGKLTINSLPQRDMPDIHITVISVAPEAVKDQDGVPIYYSAKAEILEADLDKARQVLGDNFRLAIDMPVTAVLEGSETTFFEFPVRPFIHMLDEAFEAA